jgi:hypothetical protein
MNHSKLPWKAVKTALNAISVKAKGGHKVCEIINDDCTTLTPIMEDNTAFIVCAVNCHEELLSALRRAAEVLKEETDGLSESHPQREIYAAAEQAIRKAEGRK